MLSDPGGKEEVLGLIDRLEQGDFSYFTMNILFLCTANKQRSRTAEELFSALDKANTYQSAGLSAKYVAKANTTLCTKEMLAWADKVYVFEDAHIERIKKYTGDAFLPKVLNLHIKDEYQYFQRKLVLLILERCDFIQEPRFTN